MLFFKKEGPGDAGCPKVGQPRVGQKDVHQRSSCHPQQGFKVSSVAAQRAARARVNFEAPICLCFSTEKTTKFRRWSKAMTTTDEGDLRFRGKADTDGSAQSRGFEKTESGLQYKVVKSNPAGERPGPTTTCRCHYRGTLTDGTEFDSSYDRGPILFRPDQVVPGWSEALQLMRQGEKWEIILPSDLAYGERGVGPIPPNATLMFELELLEVGADSGGSFFSMMTLGALLALGLLLFLVIWLTGSKGVPPGPVTPLASLVHAKGNPHVFFDLEAGGKALGRIEFELFKDVAPMAVENFRALCTGEKGPGLSETPRHFKGSPLHRIIPGFMAQGGDITHGNGRGGESIYGKTFRDEWEHGIVHHTEPGLLSMANRGRNSNGSQFFITFAATPWLDGKHVVFGRVLFGMDIVKELEKRGSRSGTPTEEIRIVDSGELGMDGKATPTDGAGPSLADDKTSPRMGWGMEGKGWGDKGWGGKGWGDGKGAWGYSMPMPIYGMFPPMWGMKGKGKGKGKQLKVDDALKVWLGNVPESITWKELQDHVNQHMKSKWVEIFRGKGKGTAAVVFGNADEAREAIPLLNGSSIGGQSLVADSWARGQKE
eukprot:s1177_g9.t1